MSLRDAFTAIQRKHWASYESGTYACNECGWSGNKPADHALHVVDAQIAYLRDNLAQHADEIGLKRETSHATRQCSYPGSGGPCEGHAHTRFVTGWEPIR